MSLRRAVCIAVSLSALALGATGKSFAQTPFSVNYDFTGFQTTNAGVSITSNPSGATFTPFVRGAGINPAAQTNNAINSNSFTVGATLADAIINNEYYSFSVTPLNGNRVSLSSFVFGTQRSNTGPASIVFRSSVDGFASDIATAIAPTSNAIQTATLTSNANTQNLTGTTEIRLYAYGATNVGGTLRIGANAANGDQFVVNGSLVAAVVPESNAGMLLGVGSLLGLVGKGLRARRSVKTGA